MCYMRLRAYSSVMSLNSIQLMQLGQFVKHSIGERAQLVALQISVISKQCEYDDINCELIRINTIIKHKSTM